MRPLLLRLAAHDRHLLVLGGGAALAALALATLLLATRGDGEDAPPEVAASPTATATPAFVLPALPAGCEFMKSHFPGPPPLRAGERIAMSFDAHECVTSAWDAIPVDRLAGELSIELQEPDGPAELLVALTPSLEAGTLRWSGAVTYPLGGNWHGRLRIAGQAVETFPFVWQVAGESGLTSRPGLPLPAVEHELTVLNIDRPGEPARWPALESGGMAWIPGATQGTPARVVWVQARDGREWVVAGDPTSGAVTPLFEVELPVSLHGAPDGRAFVAVDRIHAQEKRIRFYDAQRSKLIDVGTSRFDLRAASWSPDSGVVLIGGEQTLLLGSDGSRLSGAADRSLESVTWAPDSTWALAVLQRRGTQSSPARNEFVRIDIGARAIARLVDAEVEDQLYAWPAPAVSPDGARFALAWWDPSQPAGTISVFDRDEPLPLRLEDRVVASYPAPGASSQVQWLTSMSWTPDGGSLIASMFMPSTGQIYPPDTSVQVIDVASKTVRLVVKPREGHYGYGPLWMSADGRALFKVWHSCVACDGGRGGLDVIDLASGTIVRTIDGGYLLGTTDEVRYLLSSPDGLLSVRGLESPRILAPGTWGTSTAFAVAPSPDGNRLAVRQAPGRMSAVVAVAPDGSTQTALGFVRPEARIAGLRDPSTALVLDYQAGWAWSALANGALTPLPQQGESRLETALETAVAISPDRSVAGYWVPGATKPEVTLQLLDLTTGTVTSSVATSQQTKGLRLAMSVDGRRVAFPDNDALVAVDVPTRTVRRFPYQQFIGPAGSGLISNATHGPGGTFEMVAGGKLWRLDPISGDVEVVTDRQPSPGGWRSEVELSRSPDGQRLVALTRFGLFELQADGSWRFMSGAGIDATGSRGVEIVWSPDSKRVAYLGSDGTGAPGAFGIVVVGLDGSGAYELVKQAVGRQLRLLEWLPDGRIVYAVITSGL